jgi:hypothetical protein
MGKKKSKSSKQKQTKAKNNVGKASSLGGVMVTKGAAGKGAAYKAEAQSLISPSDTQNSHKGQPNMQMMKRNKFGSKKMPKKPFMTPSASAKDEKSDFDRRFVSLQEREWAKDMAGSKKKKKGTPVTPVEMQAASFSVDKSTNQILQENVVRMETLTGVGQEQANATLVASNQGWAAALEPEQPKNDVNPYAAFHEDSDDENDWNVSSKTEPVNPFQMAPPSFAPPSFSFAPAATSAPIPAVGDMDDFDPDL